MKKLLRSRKKRSAEDQKPSRITNETVAEHREKILAGGRRFKYPVQYAKNRLVINTIIISILALVIMVLVVWWQLYYAQNSSTFLYRITRAVPVPVASVDGYLVNYSNYLVGYRSHAYYLEHKEGVDLESKENKRQVDFIKRRAINDAIADAYAAKLAKEYNVSVTDEEVDKALELQRRSRDGVTSVETYNAIILDHFNWTPEEARGVTERKLLRQKVAYKIDEQASKKRTQLENALKTEKDFDKIAASLGGEGKSMVVSGITPLVPRSNQDGGLARAADALKKGETSSVFKSTSGDGYYAVRLLATDAEGQVSYAFIKIPLTAFEQKLDQVRKDNKIDEFIDIPEISTKIQQ